MRSYSVCVSIGTLCVDASPSFLAEGRESCHFDLSIDTHTLGLPREFRRVLSGPSLGSIVTGNSHFQI